MNIIELIKNRTSYRGPYLNAKVPREHLKLIMEAGLAAPSGCNKQTTSLIAVDDEDTLKKLYAAIHPSVGETSPAMICVLAKKIIAYRDRCYYIQDYSAAIENMLLAIVDLGYQSCWVEGHITDTDQLCRKMAAILEVPEEYELVCYLPIGVAEKECQKTAKLPFEERAWFNRFGGN